MSKANYINKRLVTDYIAIQNWLQTRKIDYRNEWYLRCHEMDFHEMAEHQGYVRAIQDTIDELCNVMNGWPDLKAHRNCKKVDV